MSEFYAVILSDFYDIQFNKFINTMPKTLIIEHQINWLSKNYIDQIIVFYRNEQIAEYQQPIIKCYLSQISDYQCRHNSKYYYGFIPDVALKNEYALWEEFILRFARETEVARYIKQKETFCRYQKYHLNQFLQLSYKHYILSEQVTLNYQIKCNQFAEEFDQAHLQFKEYHETLLQSRSNKKSRKIRRW